MKLLRTSRHLARRRSRSPLAGAFALLAAAGLCLWIRSCLRPEEPRWPPSLPPDPSLVLVTGYCNCQECCSWERTWFGLGKPVYSSGKLKGQPKEVGVTARGTKARHGTIAADPKVFPFGTKLAIPVYGTGVVEDVGGAIKGRHIDIWFDSHEKARRWGRRWLDIRPADRKDG